MAQARKTQGLIDAIKKSDNSKIEKFLKSGADVNGVGYEQESPLFVAVVNVNYTGCQILLEAGANPNFQRVNDKITPFMAACQVGDVGIVKMLLGKGGDVNMVDREGIGSLFVASSKGHEEIIPLLLDTADINGATKTGTTSLFVATYEGHLEVVRLLLEKGANVDQTDHSNFTALYVATQSGRVAVVEMLLRYGASVHIPSNFGFTPLFTAVQERHEDVVAVLLKHGADPNFTIDKENTPLMLASLSGNTKIVSQLLQRGARVNRSSPIKGTPIHAASFHGHLDTVQLLLKAGADPNSINDQKMTPLQNAMHLRTIDTAELLLENGANVNSLDQFGCSALHLACLTGNVRLIRLLLQFNADINTIFDGTRPADVARRHGHINLVKVIQQHEATLARADEKPETDSGKANLGKPNALAKTILIPADVGDTQPKDITHQNGDTLKTTVKPDLNFSKSEIQGEETISGAGAASISGFVHLECARKMQRDKNTLKEKMESCQDPEEIERLSKEVDRLSEQISQEAEALFREGIKKMEDVIASIKINA